MNLSSLAVKRPVAIIMMVLIIVLLGGVSLSRLPLDLLPEIEVPVAVVSTSYSGVGPQEIENLITRPIEGAIATVSGINSISSISSQGSSIVIAQFNFGTDMDQVSLEMREKVDRVKGLLPEAASQPMVLKIDPNAMPIIQLSLSTSEDLATLQNLAEDTLKPRLERLDGVASVDVTGGFAKEISVRVNEQKLTNYGLSINQLAQIIGAGNLNLPGGTVKRGSQELSIRTMGEFRSIDEIRALPLALPTGGILHLEDIAEVDLVNKEIEALSRTNGKDSINISIQKQSGRNTVRVAKVVNREIEILQREYPNIEINKVVDQSIYIEKAISNVFKNAVFGSLLAIAILYLFLRNIRTTLIIGTSIPVSVIATFILLYFNGITLNLMTLGGLALGVGMLVDNAIVVLENIYRFRVEGHSRKEAAVKGASEVAMAVTASTLTTVAVFIPIVFVEGITSTIFKELAMTVTLSLGASLLVSLTLIPMLASKILKVEGRTAGHQQQGKKEKQKIYNLFEKLFMAVEGRYKKTLNWSLRHRKLTLLVSIIVFLGSLASLLMVGAEFFPSVDEGQINITVNLPVGSQLYQVDEILKEVEEKLTTIEEVDVVFSNIGSSGNMGMGGQGSSRGEITVMLKSLQERERSTGEIADQLRRMVKDIPGAEITVAQSANMMMGLGGDPISIRISGDDLSILEQVSNDFKSIIESVEGTREVKTSLSEGIPEVHIAVNKNQAAIYGLTTAQIANSIRSSVAGTLSTRYKYQGNEIDVVIRGEDGVRESLDNLGEVGISTPMGSTIPLSQLADISVQRGPVRINRQGQERTVTVSGQITGRDLRSVIEDIRWKLASYELPQGYGYQLGGQNEELEKAFRDLSLAIILAILLIYMVLAAQFESLIYPFIIILTVPLAFAGGALGLFVTGRTLSVPSLIGVIILAGIVVNNAIVLVDYINTLRGEGKERMEAITIAGPVRLRPILMTTLTTALGLVPLALGIGEGSEIQAPLATVVIGGLLLSTVLTLVLIPVVYTIIDDLSISLKGKIRRGSHGALQSE